jgi:hypothetical protein
MGITLFLGHSPRAQWMWSRKAANTAGINPPRRERPKLSPRKRSSCRQASPSRKPQTPVLLQFLPTPPNRRPLRGCTLLSRQTSLKGTGIAQLVMLVTVTGQVVTGIWSSEGPDLPSITRSSKFVSRAVATYFTK